MSSMISQERKLIFIHLPKAAGKSVMKILREYDDFMPIHFRWRHSKKTAKLEVKEAPLIEMTKLMLKNNFGKADEILSDYHVFAITRNPYERFVSCYNYFFNTNSKSKYKEPISFEDALFKDKFVKEKYPGFYHHAKITYSKHLGDLDKINTILKFENLEKELREFLLSFDISFEDIPHTHKSSKMNMEYWNMKREEFFFNKFKEDFQNFDYKRMIFEKNE